MSYQQQQSSYGDAYAPYGQQQQNPYGGQQGGYGQNPYAAQDVELQQQQPQGTDHITLLNKIRTLGEGIDTLKRTREDSLAAAQNALLQSNNATEDQVANQHLDGVQQEITTAFAKLKEDFARLKNTPGSGDDRVSNQLSAQGRKLRSEIESYTKSQKEFRGRLEEQVRRRYQIVNPDATPEQVEEGVRNVIAGTEQSFQVAGGRTQRANDARNAVQERSDRIRKIERDFTVLAALVEEVMQLIAQQEPAVQQIDQGAENVARDLENANTQLGQAVVSARKARRWKWYALIIVIIIIAIIVAVAVGVTQS